MSEISKTYIGVNKMSEISKTYNYHKPSSDGLERITKLRRAFTELDTLMKELAPASRELSVAVTNLEQAAMWAIKAVVCNDPQSVVE